MDDIDRMIVFGVAAPFAIACLLVLPRSKRTRSGSNTHAWRLVLAVGTPVVLAFLTLFHWPWTEWTDASAWWSRLNQDQLILYAVLLSIAVGLAMSRAPGTLLVRAALILALAGLVTLATWPIVAPEAWYYRATPAAGILLLGGALEYAAVRRSGFCLPMAMCLALATTSVLVAATGMQPLGVSALAAAVALGVLAIVSLWRRHLSMAQGVVPVVATLLVMPPLIKWLYIVFEGDDFPAAAFLLPMLAPLMVLAAELPKIRHTRDWLRNLIVLTLVAAMCASGVALAFRPHPTADRLLDNTPLTTDP
ncbi:MAG: hypothetical protein IIC49_00780 [Planctomycetes bacterium]|nr:hypothetical protein [Planctomycetota bacterium]